MRHAIEEVARKVGCGPLLLRIAATWSDEFDHGPRWEQEK
jgi:hypothetical protein